MFVLANVLDQMPFDPLPGHGTGTRIALWWLVYRGQTNTICNQRLKAEKNIQVAAESKSVARKESLK